MPALVIGPPHSGVALMTTFLSALGMSSCPESHVASLAAINSRALEALGGRIDCPPTASATLVADLTPFVDRATAVLNRSFTDRHYVIGVEGGAPLAELWRRAIKAPCAVVVMVRDPEEVAQSALVRDGLSVPVALTVWYEALSGLLQSLRETPVIVVSYRDFVDDPMSVGADVADALGAWGHLDPTTSVWEATRSISVGADPHRVPLVIEPAKLRVGPGRLYRHLLTLTGESPSFDPGAPKPMPWWMEVLLNERRIAFERERVAEAKCAEALEAARNLLERAKEDRASVLVEHAFVVGERDTATEQRDALRAALEALEHDHEDALGDLTDARARLTSVQEKYESLQRLQAFARMRWWARFVRELRD